MEADFSNLLPESLLVDFPEVDAQHEQVFCHIEALKTACFENNYQPIKQMEALLAFLEYHFAAEERIAEQAGLDFSLHARTHRCNLRALRKGMDEVLHDVRDVYSFLRYVEFWFERHILEYDKPFISCLQACLPTRSVSPQLFACL
ncbi:MAG: hemerythrin family protein [Rhodocyclaceae bacterium]